MSILLGGVLPSLEYCRAALKGIDIQRKSFRENGNQCLALIRTGVSRSAPTPATLP
jgi:hypothetical protein